MTVVDEVDDVVDVDVGRWTLIDVGGWDRTKGPEGGGSRQGKGTTWAYLQWGITISDSMPQIWSAMLVIVSSSRFVGVKGGRR
jgi:hypothetical protein